MKKIGSKNQGFTLVEVLVVMIIIGTLIALILPNAMKSIHVANVRQCSHNIRSLDSGIQLYYSDHRAWPALADGIDVCCPYIEDEACDASPAVTLLCAIDSATPYTTEAHATLPNVIQVNRTDHFDAFPDTHVGD